MINFDEEINEFKPSLEISEVEDAIVRSRVRDVTELIADIISHSRE